jgi:AraC family transcriptional regulator of adaptative response/methylated-DNA-[protein]-cysteine methyltransferase
VAVVIPCHRVVRGDGDTGGYRWGVGRKQKLLALERRGV